MMRTIDWSQHGDGTVLGIPIHDSYITEIHYKEPDNIRITFSSGELPIYMILENIIEAGVFFCKSPQCYAMFAWGVQKSPYPDIQDSDNPWKILFPYEDQQGLIARRNRIIQKNPTCTVIRIACIFGGDIAVCCDEIKFMM